MRNVDARDAPQAANAKLSAALAEALACRDKEAARRPRLRLALTRALGRCS